MDAEALTLLGVALAQQGNTTRAIEIFREALQIDPELTNAKQNLERALSELGNKQPLAVGEKQKKRLLSLSIKKMYFPQRNQPYGDYDYAQQTS